MFDTDIVADIYDAMIDWPKRLAHEGPFYRRLFERIDAHSVVDVACGTGRHAAMFHSWGLRVEAADISPAMIDRAKAAFGQPSGLRWVVRGFDEPVTPAGGFDAAVCVGNSLALAPDQATAEKAIRQMLAAVRPGGVLVVQLLNLWRLPDGPCVWQKCQRLSPLPLGEGQVRRMSPLPLGEGQGEGDCPDFRVNENGTVPFRPHAAPPPASDMLILKGVHRSGPRGYVDLAVVDLARPALMHTESTPLLALEASDLATTIAQNAGARNIAFFGGYDEQPFDRQESVDLILVAER